ncbi:MAG: putative cell division protein, ftsX-related protein [Candidatus Nomurabacteria bacterium GW2011_GWD1_44_10]|nr:MAG: putative cell division protein, ftsX-related protein [Candidatus Nomurabacteria bacterium GW2011_GWD1_44_10]
MYWTALKRIIKAGFISFWRNGSVSLSAVFVMIVALFMIASTLLITAFLGTALEDLQDKIDINIYVDAKASEEQIISLQKQIETIPEVDKVTYISREDALTAFRARHENDHRIIQALDEIGDNPLPAALTVKAKEPSQYQGIANFLSNKSELSEGSMISIISKVNYNDNKVAIERLSRLIAGVKKLGSIITAGMIGISILITFNTIRLAIFIARDEIGVMRLVGGSNEYVRGPFVVEGILYGLVAAFLTLILFYPITYWLKNTTQVFYGGVDLLQYFVANFVQIFLVVVLSGIALGAVSSYLAVRKYLTSR